jgi:NADH-quinone oxidoreductase subunit A
MPGVFTTYFNEYQVVAQYLILCIVIAVVVVALARILAPRNIGLEKLSAYECGFEPFITARVKFDVSFIVVAILFLIFDLEIMFLIPWVINIVEIGFIGFCLMAFFLFLLMFGFLIEWLRGVLDWDSSRV